MKILITTDLFWVKTNGVVTSLTCLYRLLKEKGQEVKILTLSFDQHAHHDGDVYSLPSFSLEKIYPDLRGSLIRNNDLLKEIIDWQPDIIHSQCEFFSYSWALKIQKATKAKLIHTCHTLYAEYLNYLKLPVAYPLFAQVLKRRLKTAAVLIAPSQKTAEQLVKEGHQQKILVIPTTVELKPGTLQPKEKSELKAKLQLPADAFIFLSLGRLGQEKHPEILVDCFARFHRQHPHTRLLFVGDGPMFKPLQQQIKEAGLTEAVSFAGAIGPEDAWRYYQLADCFLSASQSEAQGLVFLEACVNGLPLLARKDECLAELLIEDANGFYFSTAKDFVKAANKMLGNKAFLRQAGHISRHLASKYDPENFVNAVLNVYNGME